MRTIVNAAAKRNRERGRETERSDYSLPILHSYNALHLHSL